MKITLEMSRCNINGEIISSGVWCDWNGSDAACVISTCLVTSAGQQFGKLFR